MGPGKTNRTENSWINGDSNRFSKNLFRYYLSALRRRGKGFYDFAAS